MDKDLFRGHITADARFVPPDEGIDASSEPFKQYPADDPEIRAAVESIDFNDLQRIFTKHLHKSTPGETRPANIVPPENIIYTNDAGVRAVRGNDVSVSMSYALHGNSIVINVESIRRTLAFFDGPLELEVLLLLCHEQGHAASSSYMRKAKSGRITAQTGVMHAFKEKGADKFTMLQKILNEGINDKLARFVAREYLERRPMKGVTPELLEALTNPLSGKTYGAVYLAANHLVDALAHAVSKQTGIDRQAAWDMMLHWGLKGLMLGEAKGRKHFNRTVGREKLVEQLARAKWSDVPEILGKNGLDYEFRRFVQLMVDKTLAAAEFISKQGGTASDGQSSGIGVDESEQK